MITPVTRKTSASWTEINQWWFLIAGGREVWDLWIVTSDLRDETFCVLLAHLS